MASTNSTSTNAAYSYLRTSAGRFSGLVSGMDIESIMEKLMKAESAKLEKLQQQKQKYEWQRDAYRSVNTKLEAFRTETFDKYSDPANFLVKKATVSDSSKVSVTAGSSATGNLTISSVSQLASAATVKSSGTITDNAGNVATKATTVGELFSDSENVFDADGNGTLKLKVFKSSSDTEPTEITVTFNKNDSLETLAKNINKQGGVTAVVGDNGAFSLTSNVTGEYAGGAIQVASDTTNILGKLNLQGVDATNLANGKNAKYNINGIDLESKSNTFSQNGYSISLNSTFDESSSVNISSSTDTDTIVNNIKSFVELYNGLVESLDSPLKEKKNYDYQPLTDAQKAEMTTEEIAKWEEKAKEGILRNDTTISKVLSDMRTSLYAVTTDKDSKYNTLYNIGITTTKTYTDGGKLEIDEDKLRAAIETNPEAVADLFTKTASEDTTTGKGGLIAQLRTTAKTGIDAIADKAGREGSTEASFTLGKNLTDIAKQISDWEDRLEDIENRYYKQFTAMEAAIQKANSQASIFSS